MFRNILFFLLLSIQITAQTTYYVSNSQGNDSNNGTSQSTPWKSLSKINNTSLNPGDIVLFKRGDIWSGEQLNIHNSGSSGNQIYFKDYGTGNKPVLSGNNTLGTVVNVAEGTQYLRFENLRFIDNNASNVSHWSAALLKLGQRCQNIEIINCEFDNLGGTFNIEARRGGLIVLLDPAYVKVDNCDFTGTMYGIFVVANFDNSHNDGHHLTFSDNYFHRLGNVSTSLTSGNGRGIAVEFKQWFSENNGAMLLGDGTPGATFGQEGTFRDILLDGNRVDSAGFGFEWYRDPDFLNSSQKGYNWTITNNIFNLIEAEAIGLTEIGWRGGLADRSVISGNIIDSVGMKWINNLWGMYHGVNAVQTHAWDNVIIENNTISNFGTTKTGDGHGIILDIAIETGNIIPPNVVVEKACDSIIIRNNFIYNALTNTGGTASGINVYASKRCEVYNNIIFDSQVGIYAPIGDRSDANKIAFNTVFNCGWGIRPSGQKNVVVKNNIVAFGDVGLYIGGINDGSDYDYNLVYGNTSYNTQGYTSGPHDIIADPLFIDSGNKNFNLLSNSPAIDAGTSINLINAGLTGDFTDNLRPVGLGYDIGALEYGSSSSGNSINVNIRIFLEGSFNVGSMATTLLNNGHLPLNQPYNQAPWNYNGTESVSSIPPDVVDWVLLELRTGTTSSTTVSRKAVFIKSDGLVVNLYGVSPVSFSGISDGNYYIVIRHRNHLAVMSSNAISLTSNSGLYDLTTGSDNAFGSNSLQNLGNGKWGMYAGDGDFNGLINVIDYGSVGNHLSEIGYKFGDIDMNGVINLSDYTKTNLNLFKNSQVPN